MSDKQIANGWRTQYDEEQFGQIAQRIGEPIAEIIRQESARGVHPFAVWAVIQSIVITNMAANADAKTMEHWTEWAGWLAQHCTIGKEEPLTGGLQ